MKRIMMILTVICLLLVPGEMVLAEESTISMTVPDQHKIDIVAEHAEAIYQDADSLEEAEEDEKIYMVDRFSEPEFKLVAKDGYKITKVLLGDTDITDQVRDGLVTLPEVYEDQVLTIETEELKAEDKPGQADDPEKTGKGSETSDKNFQKKVKAAVTGDMAKCGVTTCILLAAAGVAVSILKKREE